MFSIPVIQSLNKKTSAKVRAKARAAERKRIKELAALEEKKAQARSTLKELNIEVEPISILALLQDPEKLDEVVRKLKLKVFW